MPAEEWETDALGHLVPSGTREILDRQEYERQYRADLAAERRRRAGKR